MIFKIIGEAEAAANLLCEFKIAEKNDEILTKIKNGIVNLVNSIAISIFCVSLTNPGAISPIKYGVKSSIINTSANNAKSKKLKTWFANLSDFDLSLISSEV